MAYNDEAYLRASVELANAIEVLADNEQSREDIEEMVENALDDNFGIVYPEEDQEPSVPPKRQKKDL